MKREAEYFGEAELELIYMARRLRDALALEQSLTEAGIDYLVETGTYTAGYLMRRELTGAFFYVQPLHVLAAHELLRETKRKPYQPE